MILGMRAVPTDVPTDPFMMLVVPSDHFSGEAGFATPNYCDEAKVSQSQDESMQTSNRL